MTDAAPLVLQRALASPPTLGSTRLVCIDGPAGAGKTTLAGAVERLASDGDERVTMVHCDELLQGWRGLPGLAATVEALLRPLAEDRTGTWTRWAWDRGDWAESHDVEPGGLLVLEGTGSWAPAYADLVGVLAWVQAPRDLRLERGMARDGEEVRAQWLTWLDDEASLHARLGTRDHADVLVDGVGRVAGGDARTQPGQ